MEERRNMGVKRGRREKKEKEEEDEVAEGGRKKIRT
jgi:hypothetical protein